MSNPFRTLNTTAANICREHPHFIAIAQRSKKLAMPALDVDRGSERFPNTSWDEAMVFALYWLQTALDEAGQDATVEAQQAAVAAFKQDIYDTAMAEAAYQASGTKPKSASAVARAAATADILASIGL